MKISICDRCKNQITNQESARRVEMHNTINNPREYSKSLYDFEKYTLNYELCKDCAVQVFNFILCDNKNKNNNL